MIKNFDIRFELDRYGLRGVLPLGEEFQGRMILTPKESIQGVTVGFELIVGEVCILLRSPCLKNMSQ